MVFLNPNYTEGINDKYLPADEYLSGNVRQKLSFAITKAAEETVSWVCIVGAAPIAVAGFFQYNGMTLEKFLWAWFKSSFLMAGPRVWKSENYYLVNLGKEDKKRK